jgi:hypothetical protein
MTKSSNFTLTIFTPDLLRTKVQSFKIIDQSYSNPIVNNHFIYFCTIHHIYALKFLFCRKKKRAHRATAAVASSNLAQYIPSKIACAFSCWPELCSVSNFLAIF